MNMAITQPRLFSLLFGDLSSSAAHNFIKINLDEKGISYIEKCYYGGSIIVCMQLQRFPDEKMKTKTKTKSSSSIVAFKHLLNMYVPCMFTCNSPTKIGFILINATHSHSHTAFYK